MASVRQWVLDARSAAMIAEFADLDDFDADDDEPADEGEGDEFDALLGGVAKKPLPTIDEFEALLNGKDDELDWHSLLDFNEEGAIRPTLHNVSLIVMNVQLYRQMRAEQPYGTLPLYLQGEAAEIAKDLQETRRVESADDGIRGQIEAWLLRPVEDGGYEDLDDCGEPKLREETCLVEIWCECLMGDRKAYDQAKAQMLGRIVGSIEGWQMQPRRKLTPLYGQQRVYVRV